MPYGMLISKLDEFKFVNTAFIELMSCMSLHKWLFAWRCLYLSDEENIRMAQLRPLEAILLTKQAELESKLTLLIKHYVTCEARTQHKI